VDAFGCNSLIYSGKAPEAADKFALTIPELKELLPQVKDKASHVGLKFLWYTPTQYCEFNPVQLGLGIKSCTICAVLSYFGVAGLCQHNASNVACGFASYGCVGDGFEASQQQRLRMRAYLVANRA